jgi:hypothetical protein
MLINSPALFIDMWTKANNTTPEGCLFDMPLEGSSTDYTTQNQLLAIKAGVKYPYSGFMLPSTDGCTIKVKDITTLTNLIRFNHFLQAIIDKIQEKLCHQLGLRPTDVIKLPILFTGPDELYNSAIKSTGELFGIERGEDSLQVYLKKAYREIFNGANIGGVYHLSSNLANSIISPTFMICDTPHSILPIKEYMKDNIISPGSITHIYYADTWDTVKYQHGGLHCFTGETRDFTARATVTRANGAASSGAASSGATSYNANYNKVNKNIHALTKMVEEANMREAKAKNNTARNAAKQDKNNALGRLRSLVTDFISKYPAPPKQAAPPEQAGGSRRNKRSRRQKRTRRVRRTAKYRR